MTEVASKTTTIECPPPCDPSPRPPSEGHESRMERLERELTLERSVNAELRALLVSTMGDDLTEHVASLGHDRAVLADSIQRLHLVDGLQRGTLEQLAIDTDLWKAKFMATSVLADELESWRAFLVRQFECLQRVLADLDVEHRECRHALSVAASTLSTALGRPSTSEMTVSALCADVHHNCTLVQRITNKSSTNPLPFVDSPLDHRVRQSLSIDSVAYLSPSPCAETFSTRGERQARLLGQSTSCNYKNIDYGACCTTCRGREIHLV